MSDAVGYREELTAEQWLDLVIQQFVLRRRALGLTQEQVGEQIGVTENLVAKWETGIRRPSLYLAQIWAQVLQCHLTLKETPGDAAGSPSTP